MKLKRDWRELIDGETEQNDCSNENTTEQMPSNEEDEHTTGQNSSEEGQGSEHTIEQTPSQDKNKDRGTGKDNRDDGLSGEEQDNLDGEKQGSTDREKGDADKDKSGGSEMEPQQNECGNEHQQGSTEEDRDGADTYDIADMEEGKRNRKSYYRRDSIQFSKFLELDFAKLISRIAEEYPIYEDGEEMWDIKKIMKRRFTLRPLHTCRKSLRREKVILGLDFSGSCSHMANFFLKIARIAEKFNQIIVVDASNGFFEENKIIHSNGAISFEELKGRKIIFFGDFDGGASLVELSRIAKVYWFCCEDRYQDLSEHDWCRGYSLRDFKGKLYWCYSEHDLRKLVS